MFFVCSRLMAQLESKGQDFKLHARPCTRFQSLPTFEIITLLVVKSVLVPVQTQL